MVEVTLKFKYPWNDKTTNKEEIVECLSELSPEELLAGSENEGHPVNVDIEVY